MTVALKPLSEITEQAITVLSREIGIANTIRFINQFTTGYGNYTEERQEIFGRMSLDDVLGQMDRPRT
jgi:hypothetical protein